MIIFLIIINIIGILLTIAFYTILERKIMAAVQRRKGPNNIGFIGILQPIADGLKIIIKEVIVPSKSNKLFFFIAPLITLLLTFVNWSLITFSVFDIYLNQLHLSLLILFMISSINVYTIIIAGWSSNSRYPLFGALRSASQMISYEVSLTIVFLIIILVTNSFNFNEISYFQRNLWIIFPLFPIFIIFLISIIAETNRAPFDLPEAEAEIVAGYNIEYSSFVFALFFIGEYGNMLLMSSLTVILFIGGNTLPDLIIVFFSSQLNFSCNTIYYLTEIFFIIKLLLISLIFIFVRATYPRIRYDQLMELGWTIFLPLISAFFIFIFSLKLSFSIF
jgi:NADH-quinone oxidoreductase subunit H